MPQITYRANLSSSIYPMTIAEGGRTVIIPGPDNNFDRRVDPTGAQKDAGIPQALYLENVMPTVSGYQSVGYFQRIGGSGISPSESVGGVIELKVLDTSTNTVTVIPIAQLSSSLKPINSTYSLIISGAVPIYVFGVYSQAVVRGVCYLLEANSGQLYTCTFSAPVITLTNVTATITPVTVPTFFSINSIRCIIGTNNYLVAISRTKVFYSSTTTPTDFTASLVSGAGETSLSDINGSALWALETQNGFYLFGSRNNLYVQYTGNSRYPFKFTPVKNSSGIQYPITTLVKLQVYGEVDSIGHFVIEIDNQIKFIQGIEASAVAPEVTDFLSRGDIQELFNTATNTFIPTISYTSISQIYLHLNRYLIVSVQATGGSLGLSGVAPYDAVIIYDIVLQRYGKLKITHTDIFSMEVGIGPSGTLKTTLAFLNRSGNTIRYLSMDMYSVTNSAYTGEAHVGVLVLGKFQYVRSRKIQIHEIEVEGPQNSAITTAPNFSCVLLPSQNGRTFDTPITPYQVSNSGGLAVYNTHATGQNHSIVLKGAFNVNTVQLKFSARGKL